MPEIQEHDLINLYSDTQTLPTDRMREAMHFAQVGDDTYRTDPTVQRLERLAADKVGMEAALFCPSGHMANLIATMVHCRHGDEIIVEATAHMYYYESGSMSAVAGVIPRLVEGRHGIYDVGDVRPLLRPRDIHYPRTRMLCVENSHNRGGGTVFPLATIHGLRQLAIEEGLRFHLDGARLFNAAFALEVEPSTIVAYFDSAMFCLSKGLSAPIGSMLVGPGSFIDRALHCRKLLGGGMRQLGVLAAAGIVALEEMVDRLPIDHEHAKLLAAGLAEIPGCAVDLDTVQTNMVLLDVRGLGVDASEFAERLRESEIIVCPRPPWRVRFVTHRHITKDNIFTVLDAVRSLSDTLLAKSGGHARPGMQKGNA